MLTRRELLAAPAALAAAAPGGPLIDTHIHLFAANRAQFPYHANAPYQPPPEPPGGYSAFALRAGIAHTVIVHPEPYQDDHRYLEYCLDHEPRKDFFKGTCLFDPALADTPARMRELVKRRPGRIVALRIHAMRKCTEPASAGGAIKDRDLGSAAMKTTWRAASELGLAIQMHFIPCHARAIRALAETFRDTSVVLDHLGRHGQGTPQEYEDVFRMAKLPRVYMKFSGVGYSSKEPPPHRDVAPLIKRLFSEFGPERILWGGLGKNEQEFAEKRATFDELFAFASEADRERIRGRNAARLYGFGQ